MLVTQDLDQVRQRFLALKSSRLRDQFLSDLFAHGDPVSSTQAVGQLLRGEQRPSVLVAILKHARSAGVKIPLSDVAPLLEVANSDVLRATSPIAVALGPAGEQAVIEAVGRHRPSIQPYLLAALRHGSDPRVTEELRRIAADSRQSRDPRIVALRALARREGAGLTEFYVSLLTDPKADIQNVAMTCLLSVGAMDRGREVLAWLKRQKRLNDQYLPTGFRLAVAYLMCAFGSEHQLMAEVVDLVRTRQQELELQDRDWLGRVAPDVLGPLATAEVVVRADCVQLRAESPLGRT